MISVRRPSPALVISCLALTIALGGTSYAAASPLPKNSVGTAQLKNSAVTSPKVRTAPSCGATSLPARSGRAGGPAVRPGQRGRQGRRE